MPGSRIICLGVKCASVQEVLSADLDGEAAPHEVRQANAHLGSCGNCREWWSAVGAVNRRLRVRQAEAPADLTAAVLLRAPHVGRPESRRLLRFGIAVLAAVELAFAVIGGLAGSVSSVHGTQHLGAFAAAVAIGLLAVALKPRRASGVLPVVAALLVTIPCFAVIDALQNDLSVVGGLHHLAQLGALTMVWVLAGRPLPRTGLGSHSTATDLDPTRDRGGSRSAVEAGS